MSSSYCPRCNHYHSTYNWQFCQQCGCPANGTIAPVGGVAVVAHGPVARPVQLVMDEHKPGTGVFVVRMDEASAQEGALLAVVPPIEGDFVTGFRMIIRRPIESELVKLREQLAETIVRANVLQGSLDNLHKKMNEEVTELSKDKAALEELNKRAADRYNAANALLDAEKIKSRKLEGDIGKIREAIGSKQMADILTPAG